MTGLTPECDKAYERQNKERNDSSSLNTQWLIRFP